MQYQFLNVAFFGSPRGRRKSVRWCSNSSGSNFEFDRGGRWIYKRQQKLNEYFRRKKMRNKFIGNEARFNLFQFFCVWFFFLSFFELKMHWGELKFMLLCPSFFSLLFTLTFIYSALILLLGNFFLHFVSQFNCIIMCYTFLNLLFLIYNIYKCFFWCIKGSFNDFVKTKNENFRICGL